MGFVQGLSDLPVNQSPATLPFLSGKHTKCNPYRQRYKVPEVTVPLEQSTLNPNTKTKQRTQINKTFNKTKNTSTTPKLSWETFKNTGNVWRTRQPSQIGHFSVLSGPSWLDHDLVGKIGAADPWDPSTLLFYDSVIFHDLWREHRSVLFRSWK